MPKNTKNVKNKPKKKRSLKVSALNSDGIPFIRFGGKYLTKELELNRGDRLEMTIDKDTITLRKFSSFELAEFEQHQQEKEHQALLKKLFPKNHKQATALMVAENRPNSYSVENEVNHDAITEKHLQLLSNL